MEEVIQLQLAHRTWLKITYNKTDISTDIAPYLKSFNYNDVMSGEADDINITLEDRKELWQGDWLPDKGDTLTVSIMANKDKELPLGLFEIDEIEISSPPNEVKIKAVSVPNNSSLRGVDKSRSWEKAKLSVIAGDIAKNAGMALFYDTTEDSEIDRAEQSEQSDLSFLMNLCKDKGLALKVSDKKIIIFDEEKYEQSEPVKTVTKSKLKSFSLKSSTREVYKACHVKYQQSKDKSLIEYIYTLPNKTGKTLQINEEVKSIGEAEKLAKKKLREKNKEEITVSMTTVGDFDLLAGNTLLLEGFHSFDGKYIITRGSHDIGNNGYSVSLDLRRCLNGY